MEILLPILAIVVLIGYLMNIVKLFRDRETSFSKAIRILGIFIPVIGIIYGWF